jgi:hypothetical protein
VEVAVTEVGDLLDSGGGVIDAGQQGQIPQTAGGPGVFEKQLDRLGREVGDLGVRRPGGRYREDGSGLGDQLGCSGLGEAQEGLDRGEPLVDRGRRAAAFLVESRGEHLDPVGRQVGEADLVRVGGVLGGQLAEQQN